MRLRNPAPANGWYDAKPVSEAIRRYATGVLCQQIYCKIMQPAVDIRYSVSNVLREMYFYPDETAYS